MDLLSDVLRVVRLSEASFHRVEADSPWRVHAPAAHEIAPRMLPQGEHLMTYHILTTGRGVGGLFGDTPVELVAGDVMLFPHGDPHYLASATDAPAPFARCGSGATRCPEIIQLGGDGHTDAAFICGVLVCDRRPFAPLLASLPRLLHARGIHEGFLAAFVARVVEETSRESAGASSVLARLGELMLIEVLRHHLGSLPPGQTGWIAGLGDPVVGRALARLHAQPARNWTLEQLAAEVAASRSSLAVRFTRLVGQPPMQYLAAWRMQLAAALLAQGSSTVASVAANVGYDSEAAFSRAFKKATGKAPGAWRSRAPLAAMSRAG